MFRRMAAVPDGALCGDCALFLYGTHHPGGKRHFGSRLFGELKRNDIIVFRHEGKTLVKRIAAVGGDTVFLNDRDGSFTVNQEKPDATRVLTVPGSCFFVVGDNRKESLDSRNWKEMFVKTEKVIATLVKVSPIPSGYAYS